MSRPQAILFDLDDTLFDHHHCVRCGVAAVHSEYPWFSAKPVEELEREMLRLIDELHPEVLRGALTKEGARIERWRRLHLWCDGPAGVDSTAATVRYREAYRSAQRPVAGAIALLDRLRPRVRIGVVTNNLAEEQRGKLAGCDLAGRIDFLVTSEEVGDTKPGRRIFEVALDRAGCTAAEAVMIGDSWRADVLGALGAGIRAVWLNRHGHACPEPGAAEEIATFEPAEAVAALLLGE